MLSVSSNQGVGFWPFDTFTRSAATSGRAFEVLAYINSLHRQIMSSTAPGVTPEFKQAWGDFYRVAANYLVVAVQHPIALSEESVRARIEAFAAQAGEWRTVFQRAGGTPVGPEIHPEATPPNQAPWWLWWAVGGVGLLGLGYVGYKAGWWRKLAAMRTASASA